MHADAVAKRGANTGEEAARTEDASDAGFEPREDQDEDPDWNNEEQDAEDEAATATSEVVH